MTELILTLIIVSFFVVGVIFFGMLGNGRRFNAEIRKRGVSPIEIRDFKPDQGFLVIDYVYGLSIGIGSPVVWWSGSTIEDDVDFYSVKLVDLPKAERAFEVVRKRFPDKKIVESTTLPTSLL